MRLSRNKGWASLAVLALLALGFFPAALRPASAFTSDQSAAAVIGQPSYTSSVSPDSALRIPSNFAFDGSGNLWVADAGNNRVIEETGLGAGGHPSVGIVLGQPNLSSGFANLTQSSLNNPSGIAFDPSGNIWVTDTNNSRILEFKAPFSDGEAASVVIGQSDFTSVSMGAAAGGIFYPASVTFDSAGDLWVADAGDNRVMEFVPPFTSGMNASLVIGQPDFSSTSNSTTASGLNFPTSVRFDSSGDLWVTDGENNRVVEYKAPFTTGMNASLVLGQPGFTYSGAATTQAGLDLPGSLYFDSQGNLWVADVYNNRVLEYRAPFSDGQQASVVLGQASFTSNSSATSSTGMDGPTEVAVDKSGNLWVADSFNNRILEFSPPFQTGAAASRVLGQSDFNSTIFGGQGALYGPRGLAIDAGGDLWAVDAGDNRVVEYPSPLSSGMNASFAIGQPSLTLGNPGGGASGLTSPWAVALDKSGDLWVADAGNNRVLEFKPPFTTGMDATVVIGQPSFTSVSAGSGAAGLSYPTGIAFDSSGDLWVADAENSRVLEFVPPFTTGMSASLVLGQPTLSSTGPGLEANRLVVPTGVAFDSVGNLWVLDGGRNSIEEFSQPFTTGETGTFVVGAAGYPQTSQPSQDTLLSPYAMAFDQTGDLWVADTLNDRVLAFGAPLSSGAKASLVIGQSGFTTNLGGTNATTLTYPTGLAFDSSGNLWVSDSGNDRLLEYSSAVTGTTTSSSTSSTTTSSATTPSTTTTSRSSTSTTTTSSTSSTSSSTSTTRSTSTSSSTSTTTTSTATFTTTTPTVSSSASKAVSSTSATSSTSTSTSSAKASPTTPTYYYVAGGAVAVVVVLLIVGALVRRSRQPWRY